MVKQKDNYVRTAICWKIIKGKLLFSNDSVPIFYDLSVRELKFNFSQAKTPSLTLFSLVLTAVLCETAKLLPLSKPQ